MLKFIISIFMMCAACHAMEGEPHFYLDREIRAFKQALDVWKPALEEISETLSQKAARGDLTKIQSSLQAYDIAITPHCDAAEFIAIASGRMYTDAEIYRLPPSFSKGVWRSQDLREIIDERIALIRRTLQSWPESPGNLNNVFPP